MPEKPLRKKDSEKLMKQKPKKLSDKEKEIPEKETWAQDQREKNYYYDDAHGYEIYNAEDDDDED